MRNFAKFLLGAFLITFCASTAFSQTRKLFTQIEIKPRWVSGPEIQANSAQEPGTKPNLRWLQLNVEYVTPKVLKAAKSKNTQWLDNVVFKYDILLPKEATSSVSKNRIIFSGEVEYSSIAMDGEKHYAQAFVHPRILKRYAPDLRMRKSELQDMKIRLTINVNQSMVAYGVYKYKSSVKEPEVAKIVQAALNSMQTIKLNDKVLGRNKTPWGVLFSSYYEIIKEKK